MERYFVYIIRYELAEFYKIEFTGGLDITTNTIITNTFSTILKKNETIQTPQIAIISPITTLIAMTIDNFGPVNDTTISNSAEIVSSALGIAVNDIYKDFIESNNNAIAKMITQLEIISNTISSTDSSVSQEQVYATLADGMKLHVTENNSVFSLDTPDNIASIFVILSASYETTELGPIFKSQIQNQPNFYLTIIFSWIQIDHPMNIIPL